MALPRSPIDIRPPNAPRTVPIPPDRLIPPRSTAAMTLSAGVVADDRRPGVESRRQDDPCDARAESARHVGGHLGGRHVDPGLARRDLIPADCVDVTAERKEGEGEETHEERRREDHGGVGNPEEMASPERDELELRAHHRLGIGVGHDEAAYRDHGGQRGDEGIDAHDGNQAPVDGSDYQGGGQGGGNGGSDAVGLELHHQERRPGP